MKLVNQKILTFAVILMLAVKSFAQPSGSTLIPAGSLTMGDTFSEGGPDELPVHNVYVSAFYIDQYLVTKALWDNVYQWAINHGYSFDNTGFGKAANYPVGDIDWYDVVKWCNARSEMEGLSPCYYTSATQTVIYRSDDIDLTNACVNWNANGYRLPTEAEWEKAARGGLNGHRFPWGDTISESQANYVSGIGHAYDLSNTGYNPIYSTNGQPYTSPVGSFAANNYEIYDTAGNMWQWCWDWVDNNWYTNAGATQNDTRGPAAPQSQRVLRGGSWADDASYLRCSGRLGGLPIQVGSVSDFGFRCVIGDADNRIFSFNITNGLVNWWPGDGDAVDIVGGDNGVLQGGVTFTTGLVGQAFNFDGSSGFVSTSLLVNNPQTFSLSLWFKTANTAGGVLLGFGDTQTGFSPNYDRNIYMDDSGIIHFGVWTGFAALVNSPASYNNSSWHHVVGTYSADTGLTLYVDGNLVANNPSVSSAQNYNGWWRIGENTLAVSGQPWPYEPASFYFNGQIEDVRIYNRALSATEVQQLYFQESSGLPPNLNAGLIAYYPFNGNANDISGNGNNAVVYGATLATDRFGDSNAAYDLNGSSGYIDIPQNSTLNNLTNFTLSAWIYQRGINEGFGYRILDKCPAGTPNGWTFDTWDGSSYRRLRLQAAGSNNPNVIGATAYSLMQWHHVVATVSGTTGNVYLDGNFDGTGDVGNIPTNILDVFIGRAHPNNGSGETEWFNGIIDDVRIYNRALSTIEVQQLYILEAQLSTYLPVLSVQPQNQIVSAGTNVALYVTAEGIPLLNYQWQFNSQNIPNATNSSLTLNSVTAANSGSYSVVVSNPYGSVTSATASLAVLTDGANGNTPVQITATPIASKPNGVTTLVIITHGDEPEGPAADLSWMSDMQSAILQRVGSGGNYFVTPYYWVGSTLGKGAWTLDPQQALENSKIIGTQLGQQIGNNYQYVHLIGHSAGAGLIQAAADVIRQASPSTIIQTTFLDPFVGFDGQGISWYGSNATWSDNYFAHNNVTGAFTGGELNHTYNVDVSWLYPDPQHPNPKIITYAGDGLTGQVAFATHEWPHDFYIDTVLNTTSGSCAAGYGFPLSEEGGDWSSTAGDIRGLIPIVLCGSPSAIQNPFPLNIVQIILASGVETVYSANANLVGDAGFILQSVWSALPLVKSVGIHPLDETSTNTPAWLAVGVSVTNAINFVQFDAAFTDTNSAQGLLTVYWNTNQIGMVDERVAATNLQTYRFELPGTVSGGLYTLSFRLDSFANSSSVAVTNVATGFVGLTQPIALGISITNGAPLLQLTAATNFTYLIQSSTNLVDWTPTALLLNTNGMVQFMDSPMTNSGAMFYRATLP